MEDDLPLEKAVWKMQEFSARNTALCAVRVDKHQSSERFQTWDMDLF